VAGLTLRACHEWTPWDDTPLIGFCRQLEFRYLAHEDGGFAPFDPPLARGETHSPRPMLVVHESRVADLRPWPH
jgi:hypothetical protein